jgi:hypothetical protein
MIQNYDQSIFLTKNQQNATHFFNICIILLQITFFGNSLTKSVFLKNSGHCYYIYAYWLQFEDFFEIMPLVKSKFT